LLKKGVERRCERRGVGCKEPRRRRFQSASGRSGDVIDCHGAKEVPFELKMSMASPAAPVTTKPFRLRNAVIMVEEPEQMRNA
jgi:hypothetical protein